MFNFSFKGFSISSKKKENTPEPSKPAVSQAEAAAREILKQREVIAQAELKIKACQDTLSDMLAETGKTSAILGNAKVYTSKRVHFDFGEDKDDKRKKAFKRGLLKQFYYRMAKYELIHDELQKPVEEQDAKIKKLMDKYNPTVTIERVLKVKHVNPSVDL